MDARASEETGPAKGAKARGLAGYVMAGGGSTRFGRDKALVEFNGKTMLERAIELLRRVTEEAAIVAAAGKYPRAGARMIADRWPGEGPLGGIVTALLDAASFSAKPEWALIVSCDMPFLSEEWLRFLTGRAVKSRAEVLVANSARGPEPLCACWKVAAATRLEEEFLSGTRKITQAMQAIRTEMLDEPEWKRFDSAGRLFWNMNTAADYDEVRRIRSEAQP